ncbi:hypothetical protein [Persicobacter diffluens]|uniref:Lipoprotein n=1 Tax=Persicobacter diffluens TaxID=981 RepID=A0AAN5AJN1_9BACT|nr:hypothetical protein PEDI_17610 [Persicobacter diffluens]
MRVIKFYLLLGVLILSSCRSDERRELSTHCFCTVTEHYAVSTNQDDNITKEYTFKDSQLFDFGVARKDYALSAALFLYSKLDTLSYQNLKLNFIKTGKSEKTYFYSIEELAKNYDTYANIRGVANQFVRAIYDQRYHDCYEKLSPEIPEDEVKTILAKVSAGLDENYLTTEIVSFKQSADMIDIFGLNKTHEEKGELFKMSFKREGLEIIAFEF